MAALFSPVFLMMGLKDTLKKLMLTLTGAVILAGLLYCTDQEAYYRDQQAFVEGVSYEAATLLDLNAQQLQHVMAINYEFYERMQARCKKKINAGEAKNEIQELVKIRNQKVMTLLNPLQKRIWKDSLNDQISKLIY